MRTHDLIFSMSQQKRGPYKSKASFPRHGFTLVELLVAGLLLGTVMLIAVPTLSWVVTERRAAVERQEAIEEVANIMERITGLPQKEITPESIQRFEVSDEIRDQLSDAKLTLTVEPKADTGGKRIGIELRWKNRTGQMVAPVRLAAWVFQNEGIE